MMCCDRQFVQDSCEVVTLIVTLEMTTETMVCLVMIIMISNGPGEIGRLLVVMHGVYRVKSILVCFPNIHGPFLLRIHPYCLLILPYVSE